jgi:hypothetical protein
MLETAVKRQSWTRLITADRGLPSEMVEALWETPDSVVALGEPLRKVGARSTVKLQWSGQSYVLKHYVEPTLRHALKQNVSQSRAKATWLAAHRLADAGIATPRPVAFVEKRFGPFRGESYLLYPYVEGQTLRAFLGDEKRLSMPLLSPIREQLVEFWNCLKRLQVSLADTNLKNFIVGDAQRLWVIDLDKARFHRDPHAAARQQERGWRQMANSAQRTGNCAVQLVEELRYRNER